MEEEIKRQKPPNHNVRILIIAIIVVIMIAIVLLSSYSLTADPLRTVLGYAAVILLPILLILLFALVIIILHKRLPSSLNTLMVLRKNTSNDT